VISAAALAGLEDIIGRARVAARIGALLPIGVRRRQLPARTLLPGMALVLAGHRPAHLTRVHQALTSLPGTDQARPGVIAGWKTGPHLLTCRQTGRTFGLAVRALEQAGPAATHAVPAAHHPAGGSSHPETRSTTTHSNKKCLLSISKPRGLSHGQGHTVPSASSHRLKLKPGHRKSTLAEQRIRRKQVLGGLIHEYQIAA